MADNISCSVAEFQILSLLETIKHTQDQLMAKVNFLTSRLTITPGPEVEMPANIQFPLEQLEAVEAILNEPSNGPARQRVISSLATIGGQDVKRVTWNILGRMFTDDVSYQINWKGVNNKKPLAEWQQRPCFSSQMRWFGHLVRMPPERLPREVFRARPTGRRPRGRPRTRWEDYLSRLAWECLGIPQEELDEVAGEREVWASLHRLLPPRPDLG
nr:uncharacterized protein LOC133613269 [Nerophis lumbriciformis]